MGEKTRLGGKGRQFVQPVSLLVGVHTWTIPSMGEALKLAKRRVWKCESPKDREGWASIGSRPMDGDPMRLKAAQSQADTLIEEAIAYDARLARRAQWVRRDEGEYCCTALLASGDDAPFYKHSRQVINDATSAGEPIRVVISTDDKVIPEGTAAAFIATARLVQQFAPLEIWWQGSWLTEDKRAGYVFHVPLVKVDMDFSRLEFCIADPWRDSFSFRVMHAHSVLDVRQSYNGCGFRAEQSYMRDSVFIRHTGIYPSGESVACEACRWLGWDDASWVAYKEREEAANAAQGLPPEKVDVPTSTRDKLRWEEDQKRWQEIERKQKAEQAEKAQKRLASVV